MSYFKARFVKLRNFFFKMVTTPPEKVDVKSFQLMPPDRVRGMTKWQPELFEKVMTLPHVELPPAKLSDKNAKRILKQCQLKIRNFQSHQKKPEDKLRVILDPGALANLSHDDLSELKDKFQAVLGEDEHSFDHTNYDPELAIRHVLPEDIEEGVRSFQRMDYIVHVNLKDDYLPYKEVIGHLMLNAFPNAKLVVTKTNTIENKFRNMDLNFGW